KLSDDEMARDWRGRRISMVSQDPLTSLNPVFTIGDQVGAPFRYHNLVQGRGPIRRAVEAVLGRVRIPSPAKRLDDYPHQFSGGMRQRVLIAMAFSCNPGLIIADEPTTALDVTVQAAILRLIQGRARRTGTSVVFISHNIAVVSQICDRLYIMYAGRIVESGPTRAV
ncbi:ABC transporter ATP-binding protein, partial [Cutibacterium acnes]